MREFGGDISDSNPDTTRLLQLWESLWAGGEALLLEFISDGLFKDVRCVGGGTTTDDMGDNADTGVCCVFRRFRCVFFAAMTSKRVVQISHNCRL